MNQMEFPKETVGTKVFVRSCGCIKSKKVMKAVVIMQPSFDHGYFIGRCKRCNKEMIERAPTA